MPQTSLVSIERHRFILENRYFLCKAPDSDPCSEGGTGTRCRWASTSGGRPRGDGGAAPGAGRLLLLRLLRLAAVVEQILLLWMLLLLWCSSILLLWRWLHFVGVLVMLLMLRVARTCVDTEMEL